MTDSGCDSIECESEEPLAILVDGLSESLEEKTYFLFSEVNRGLCSDCAMSPSVFNRLVWEFGISALSSHVFSKHAVVCFEAFTNSEH